MRTPSFRALASAGLVTALAGATAAAGAASASVTISGGPTVMVATTADGHSVPPLGRARWQPSGNVWKLTAKTVSPPAGVTTVTATYVGPTVHLINGRVFFESSYVVNHESAAASTWSSAERVRVCRPTGCLPWVTAHRNGSVEYVNATTKPAGVSLKISGISTLVFWRGTADVGHVEWQFQQTQRGLDETQLQAYIEAR